MGLIYIFMKDLVIVSFKIVLSFSSLAAIVKNVIEIIYFQVFHKVKNVILSLHLLLKRIIVPLKIFQTLIIKILQQIQVIAKKKMGLNASLVHIFSMDYVLLFLLTVEILIAILEYVLIAILDIL